MSGSFKCLWNGLLLQQNVLNNKTHHARKAFIPIFYFQKHKLNDNIRQSRTKTSHNEESWDSFQKTLKIPPEEVREMKELDINKFTKTYTLPCAIIPKHVLSYKGLPLFQEKFLHFIPKGLLKDYTQCKKEIDSGADFIQQPLYPGVSMSSFNLYEHDQIYVWGIRRITEMNIHITFDQYTLKELIKAVLPVNCNTLKYVVLQGLDVIDIRFDEHHMPYKNVLTEIIQRKNPNAALISKTDVDGNFNKFSIEYLNQRIPKAMTSTSTEYGFTFYFNYGNIFWTNNSHFRSEFCQEINKQKSKFCYVLNTNAGVGDIALPLVEKNCTVYANEQHIESYKWLITNAKFNLTNDANLKITNMNQEDFLIQYLIECLQKLDQHNGTIHLIIQHLKDPLKLLRCLPNLISNKLEIKYIDNIVINIHCFVMVPTRTIDDGKSYYNIDNNKSIQENITSEIIKNLGGYDPEDITYTIFKSYAQGQDCFKCNFTISPNLLFARNLYISNETRNNIKI